MHTLLPFDDLRISAIALTDGLLLGQIDDCLRLLETLHETDIATVPLDHPMAKAWQGYELQLCEFGLTCCETYAKRNGENVTLDDAFDRLRRHLELAESGDTSLPPWFGKDEVHLDYKGLLRWLDPVTYEKRFPKVETCSPERFRYPTEV